MRIVTIITSLALGLTLAAPDVHAQTGNRPEKAGKERAAEMRDDKRARAERSIDEAEARAERQRDEMERFSGRGDDDDSDSEDHDSDSADADSDSEDHDSDSADVDSDSDSDSEDKATKDRQVRNAKEGSEARGNERAQEMRARRDERKEIMDEYKQDRKDEDGLTDPEVDELADDQQTKGKKPWWKFWGD